MTTLSIHAPTGQPRSYLAGLPKSWTLEPIRNITTFSVGWTPPSGDDAAYDGPNPWATISDLKSKYLTETAALISEQAAHSHHLKLAPAGSLLFSFKLSIGKVAFTGINTYTNEAIATFLGSSRLLNSYAYYALPFWVVRNATENIYGAKMLNARLIRSSLFALPPVAQQHQIADYLDQETGQIDELIAKQERLIELLAERHKTTIISELEKEYPLTPIKFITDLIQTGPFGSQLHSDEYVDAGIPLINPMHMKNGSVVPNEKISVSIGKANELSRHELKPGDLVIARRGELGRAALVRPKSRRFLCGTGSAIIRPNPNKLEPEYLYLAYTSEKTRKTLSQNSLGSTMENLNSTSVGNVRIPLPSLDEQRKSVDQIKAATNQVDILSDKATRVIELLKERRQVLISAAVTGKIDVREM